MDLRFDLGKYLARCVALCDVPAHVGASLVERDAESQRGLAVLASRPVLPLVATEPQQALVLVGQYDLRAAEHWSSDQTKVWAAT